MARILTLFLAVTGLVGGSVLIGLAPALATAPAEVQVGLFAVWEAAGIGFGARPLHNLMLGGGVLIAALLALALTLRGGSTPAARHLRISLALGSAATGWAIALHPWLAMAGVLPGPLLPVSATLASVGMVGSLWLFGRFSANFPVPVVLAHLPPRPAEPWWKRLWEIRRPSFYELTDARTPLFDDRLHRLLQSRKWLLVLSAMAVAAVWLPSEFVRVLLFSLLWLVLPGLGYLPACMGYWEVNYTRSDDAQRRVIRWMLTSVYIAAVAYVVVVTSYIAISSLTGIMAADAGQMVVVALVVWLLPSAWLLLLLAIVASILFRGAIEPTLVLRRTVLYSAILVALSATFVIVENALQSRIISALGLPEQTGMVITGTLIAVAAGTMREKLTGWINGWVDRLLPQA
ncbi:MAG: hypothetical protein LC632_05340 [Xanthomonadaceae bacterium]|nr:hypothetical protein [Xanthomonadaceae bacterium]